MPIYEETFWNPSPLCTLHHQKLSHLEIYIFSQLIYTNFGRLCLVRILSSVIESIESHCSD